LLKVKVAVVPVTTPVAIVVPFCTSDRPLIPEGAPVPEIVTVRLVTATAVPLGSVITTCNIGTPFDPVNCVELVGFAGPATTCTVTGVGVKVKVEL